MRDTSGPLHGLAADIAALYDHKIPVEDLYGPNGSRLYHGVMKNDRAEIDDLLRVASDRHPGPVLELACGNGRTLLPFLLEGYEVVGLDASPDMLQRLAERLEEPEWHKYADRLTTVNGDMTDFALGKRFELILLGMSTVWLLNKDQRAALLRCAREHLTEDGRFLVTLQEAPKLDDNSVPFERSHTLILGVDNAPILCTMIEYIDGQDELRLLSMLTHQVRDGEIGHSAIYYQRNHLISAETFEREIEQSGLRLVAQHEVLEQTPITKVADQGRRRWIMEIGLA